MWKKFNRMAEREWDMYVFTRRLEHYDRYYLFAVERDFWPIPYE